MWCFISFVSYPTLTSMYMPQVLFAFWVSEGTKVIQEDSDIHIQSDCVFMIVKHNICIYMALGDKPSHFGLGLSLGLFINWIRKESLGHNKDYWLCIYAIWFDVEQIWSITLWRFFWWMFVLNLVCLANNFGMIVQNVDTHGRNNCFYTIDPL